jgi:hypothetical protein
MPLVCFLASYSTPMAVYMCIWHCVSCRILDNVLNFLKVVMMMVYFFSLSLCEYSISLALFSIPYTISST